MGTLGGIDRKRKPRPRRFCQGPRIHGLDELWVAIDRGRWIWVRHKAYHPGWMMGRTLRSLQGDIARGWVFYATPVPKL